MPGSSLWLLPPTGHPLNSILESLINSTATHFNSSHLFLPHVTLTSDISSSTYSSDPQKWLDSLSFPAGDVVEVKLGPLASEGVFVRKLYSKVSKSEGLCQTGTMARKAVRGFEDEEKAMKWAEEQYMPHLSLLYHDIPKVSEAELEKIAKSVYEAGANLEGKGELGGWVGGKVVLVPTDRPIKDWAPIAEREL